jgi:hypothetical protein
LDRFLPNNFSLLTPIFLFSPTISLYGEQPNHK